MSKSQDVYPVAPGLLRRHDCRLVQILDVLVYVEVVNSALHDFGKAGGVQVPAHLLLLLLLLLVGVASASVAGLCVP